MSTRYNDRDIIFFADVSSYLISNGFDLFHCVKEQFLRSLPAEKADEE
jgi:hypothetical protein